MASFTVHVPLAGPDALARARFVRDGFSWSAWGFGPLWLFTQGAWIAGLLALAVYALFGGLALLLRLDPSLAMAGFALMQFALALEGSSLIRWELGLKGWREAGLVAGDDPDVMEQRFFEAELSQANAPVATSSADASMPRTIPITGSIIGLFPAARSHSTLSYPTQDPMKGRP